MLKQFKFSLLVILALSFFAACQSGNKDIRNDAREDVATNEVQPATPTAPTTAPATAPVVPTGPTTALEFGETTFDFGTIDAGEKVSHTYTFTNTGTEPLIFSNAKGSCGCTVPTWPREPIAVGGTGEIVVEFNSKNKNGKRNQKVTLTANTNPPQTFIYLTGQVNGEAPAAKGAQPNIQISQ